MQQIHIARHPILDQDQNLFGYELRFRDLNNPAADSTMAQDYPTTLVDTIDSPEFGRLLGNRLAFVSVTPDFIEKGFASLLPAERTILDLMQTMEADQKLLDTLGKAKEGGFELVLSLLLSDPDFYPVYDAVDYIRVDLNLFEGADLDHLLQTLLGFPARLIADNVHSRETFELAVEKGFDLFQGQFFSKPPQITTETLSPQKLTLLTLFQQVTGDAEFSEIERTFKENPDLSYKLLRMVNSAAFYRPKEINSIRQALAMLGKRNLRKWVALLLYSGAGSGQRRNPILEEAVIRGRMMELLAGHIDEDPYFAESAFITGTFSVIEAMLARPMEQIVKEVNLEDEIADALLHHQGKLGDMLEVIVRLREDQTPPPNRPETMQPLTDELLASYEEQAIREFEELGEDVES
jgi:EAL and modified HD-GYP domain-containing signal transduction protein